jgi:hypothetical protein
MNATANYQPGTLKAQIVVDGKVVQQTSSARNGNVNINWSPR